LIALCVCADLSCASLAASFSSGLRYLCTICKDSNDREFDEYSKLLKQAERAALVRDAPPGHGYMRGDMVVPSSEGFQGDDGSRAPDTSPGSTQRHLPRHAVANIADGFRPEISPQKQGPTFSVGQGGNDEWGDNGLGDELLP
jgi:hypothetical protein